MPETDQALTMENMDKQSKDKQRKVDTETKSETLKRQMQLTSQVIEDIEQILKETQRDKNLIEFLRTKLDQQQEDIERLSSEKYQQNVQIKRLKLQIEKVIEKLKENKNAASQEKTQLLKIRAEIYQEREILDRRHHDIINERRKLKILKYAETKSQVGKEPKTEHEHNVVERLMASTESANEKNKKIILEVQNAKALMEKTIATVKQELELNKRCILEHRDQIEHIIHNVKENINKRKHKWENIQRDAQIQKAVEMEGRERQTEEKDSFQTVKLKLSRLQNEMEKLWGVLKESEQQLEETRSENQESLAENTNVNTKVNEMNADIQRKRQDIENKLTQVQSERAELEKIKTKLQAEKENLQRDRRLAEADMDAIREAQYMAREDRHQSRRDLIKVRSQIKWTNFQTKKKRRALDQQLEKTMRENDELEIMKIKLQRQREEAEQKFNNTLTTIQTMTEVKTKIEQAAAQMNSTRLEMVKTQREMEKSKEAVKYYMVSLFIYSSHLSA